MSYSFYKINNKTVFYGYGLNNKEFVNVDFANAQSLLNKNLWSNIYYDPKYFKIHTNNEFYSIKNFSFYLSFILKLQTPTQNTEVKLGSKNIYNNTIIFYPYFNNNIVYASPTWTLFYNVTNILNGILPNETICIATNSGESIIFDTYNFASVKIIAVN